MYTGLSWGILSDRDHVEDVGVDGRIILKSMFKKLDRDMEWINLPQYRDRWRALVNVATNVWVP
jgi:hypothetical protein